MIPFLLDYQYWILIQIRDQLATAIDKIDKGEELFYSSGRLGNAELLQMYGYTEKEPNWFDSIRDQLATAIWKIGNNSLLS